MKRSLALACAAVALTAGSGTALAQAKFDVTIGGDVYLQGAYVDQDADAGLRSTELRNRFRFVITPTAKADNGLEYGARLRVRADNSNATPTNTGTTNVTVANTNRTLTQDRSYIFARGGFGTVQVGTINGLSDEYGFIGPNLEGIAGSADNGTLDFTAGTTGVAGRATNFRNLVSGNAATRLVYLTPTIAGFQGGVAYMPRSEDAQNVINRQKYNTAINGLGTVTGLFQDVVEVGGIYSREIGPVALEASAFYEFGQATKDRFGAAFQDFKDLNSYNIAANVGFAGFKVGAMYRNAGKSGYCKGVGCGGADQETWIVGANYTLGPVILAANYQRYEDAGNDPSDPGNSQLDLYQAGVTYTVAPGLTTGLEYSYFRARDNDLPAPFNRDKGSIVMLDTRLAF
jgi:predicted porin